MFLVTWRVHISRGAASTDVRNRGLLGDEVQAVTASTQSSFLSRPVVSSVPTFGGRYIACTPFQSIKLYAALLTSV